MGFFSSLGSGLSNIGSSIAGGLGDVGSWMSKPANQDKLAAWGQELSYLGNPGKTDPGSIYANYKMHQQHPMGDGATPPDAYAAAAAATPPMAQAPAAPVPLQIAPNQLSPHGVYQPYGQGLPQQGTSPYRLTIPTIKLGGY